MSFSRSKFNFFEEVYEVVKLIPSGRVTSYGAVAAYLGAKGSARMVGWALNQSFGRIDIPAHRVVNRVGVLSGKHYFGQPDEMQKRLEEEGITVKSDQVVNFENLFWDPAKELQL
ncbi:MAG: MGMT family protein [Candidatus Cyclobacteriaceae bacterium M3_2C_046]